MGDYGYYAQQYLSNLRGFTLGEGNDHAAMPEGTAYSAEDVAAATEAVGGRGISYDLSGSGIEKVSYSLSLDAKTGIYIYLTPRADYEGAVTATVGDGAENVAELQKDGRCRVHISDISTHQLAEPYIVTVTAGTTFDISICALSYAKTMLNYGGTSEHLKNLLVSLYRYYDSAMNYAGRAH